MLCLRYNLGADIPLVWPEKKGKGVGDFTGKSCPAPNYMFYFRLQGEDREAEKCVFRFIFLTRLTPFLLSPPVVRTSHKSSSLFHWFGDFHS